MTHQPSDKLKGVKCRATSVAKNWCWLQTQFMQKHSTSSYVFPPIKYFFVTTFIYFQHVWGTLKKNTINVGQSCFQAEQSEPSRRPAKPWFRLKSWCPLVGIFWAVKSEFLFLNQPRLCGKKLVLFDGSPECFLFFKMFYDLLSPSPSRYLAWFGLFARSRSRASLNIWWWNKLL